MQVKFSGDFLTRRKPEEVYDFLVDPNRFCPLLPDFQSMQVVDDKHFTVNVRVGISHIRGTASVKLALAEAQRPRRALYQGQGNIVGGSVSLSAGFDLEADSGGTRVNWKGEAQIVGPVASLARGLLEPISKKNIQKLMDGLQAALG